jgi:hypothetical protein
MKNVELLKIKKAIGTLSFGLFFPNENKKLNQKQGIGKQLDLVLVSIPEGKQTVTVNYIREFTGWTVKKATSFVKEGEYPKVVIYNFKTTEDFTLKINTAKDEHNIIFEIY